MSSEKKYINSDFQSFFENSLLSSDPEIYKAINDELLRQQQHIELIASENIVSNALLQAQGSVLTNKYAEGYPGKRYYGGCEFVDIAEQLAIDRAKELFKADYANVITLGSRLISKNNALMYIRVFLNTKFEGGRHLRRVKKI